MRTNRLGSANFFLFTVAVFGWSGLALADSPKEAPESDGISLAPAAFREAVARVRPSLVTIESLGSWARQLRQWGFPDVPEEYLKLK